MSKYGEVIFTRLNSGDIFHEWNPQDSTETMISREMLDEFMGERSYILEQRDFFRGEYYSLILKYQRALTALRAIDEWDCLNPPDSELLLDLPWLRSIVNEGLGES